MLNKVYFMIIFTLKSTASSSCCAVVSIEYFLSRFSKFFCREIILNVVLQNFSSVILMGYSERAFVFFALSSKYSDGMLFYLAEATSCSLNFLPNKFLLCRCNKSTSSFSVSLDCCAGKLRAAKMLYLLNYWFGPTRTPSSQYML